MFRFQSSSGKCRQDFKFIINFHGIGDHNRAWETGEKDYWLKTESFVRILDLVAAHPSRDRISITFDDGNLSDLTIAAPELKDRGLSAKFFVLTGKIDQPHYLSGPDLLTLESQGFEIGSHGVAHVRWDGLSQHELDLEIDGSLRVLEAGLSRRVTAVALPFGSYNHRVLRSLSLRGLTEVYSSDGGPRLIHGIPIPRLSARKDMDPLRLVKKIDHGFRLSERLISEIRTFAKGLRS